MTDKPLFPALVAGTVFVKALTSPREQGSHAAALEAGSHLTSALSLTQKPWAQSCERSRRQAPGTTATAPLCT